eukprot:357287-Chlamydomonas_euryale.AAC.4
MTSAAPPVGIRRPCHCRAAAVTCWRRARASRACFRARVAGAAALRGRASGAEAGAGAGACLGRASRPRAVRCKGCDRRRASDHVLRVSQGPTFSSPPLLGSLSS